MKQLIKKAWIDLDKDEGLFSIGFIFHNDYAYSKSFRLQDNKKIFSFGLRTMADQIGNCATLDLDSGAGCKYEDKAELDKLEFFECKKMLPPGYRGPGWDPTIYAFKSGTNIHVGYYIADDKFKDVDGQIVRATEWARWYGYI